MKRLSVIVSILVLTAGLTACGGSNPVADENTGSNMVSSTQENTEDKNTQQETGEQQAAENTAAVTSGGTEGTEGIGTKENTSQNQEEEWSGMSLQVIISTSESADFFISGVTSISKNQSILVYAGDYCISMIGDNGMGEPSAYLEEITDENGSTSVIRPLSYDYDEEQQLLKIYGDFGTTGIDMYQIETYTMKVFINGDGVVAKELSADEVVTEQYSSTGIGTAGGMDTENNDGDTAGDGAEDGSEQASDFTLSDYTGEYTDAESGSSISFVMTDSKVDYHFQAMHINSDIYNDYNGDNEVSTTMTERSFFECSEGVYAVDFITQYGCNGTAVFNGDGSIELTLTLADMTFHGVFMK